MDMTIHIVSNGMYVHTDMGEKEQQRKDCLQGKHCPQYYMAITSGTTATKSDDFH